MLAFELCAYNSPDGPFPLWSGGHNVHIFQKQFEMWTCQTTEHFSTLHQSILDELGPREAGGVSGCCWYMAFTLHSRVLTCTYRCCDELYLLTMVFWSVPEPMWSYPLHIDVGFWCRAAQGIKGHGHSVLVFGLAACVQRFLQILWNFWWYYGPYMMKSINSLQL